MDDHIDFLGSTKKLIRRFPLSPRQAATQDGRLSPGREQGDLRHTKRAAWGGGSRGDAEDERLDPVGSGVARWWSGAMIGSVLVVNPDRPVVPASEPVRQRGGALLREPWIVARSAARRQLHDDSHVRSPGHHGGVGAGDAGGAYRRATRPRTVGGAGQTPTPCALNLSPSSNRRVRLNEHRALRDSR